MTDNVIRDLFGKAPEQKPLEVHEHSIVSGPRNGRSEKIVHSHQDGEAPHKHEHTGPACYTIDKDDWARATSGVTGGSRKRFTKTPEGEQLPRVELEEWQKSFEIHYGENPPDFKGTGGGHLAAARMVLAFKMTIAKVVPFPGPKKAAG
jgi:hypothetical protein